MNDKQRAWKDCICGREEERMGGSGVDAAMDEVGHLLMLKASRGSPWRPLTA